MFAGRVYEKRKPRKVTPVYNIKSFQPRRKNIWEYLNDDKAGNFDVASRKKLNKQTLIKRSKSGTVKFLIFIFLAFGLISKYLRPDSIFSKIDFETKIISKTNLYRYLGVDSAPMNEECCHRMKHLALALNRAERALSAYRYRRLISRRNLNTEYTDTDIEVGYIEGCLAEIGENTTEWGGNVALWGILPLWRAASPPDTVLKMLRPAPSDCWPFRGSFGELIIHLPKKLFVAKISVEHIRPDTARSAPKYFEVFGILGNNTRIKATDGIYEYNKPAKQFFRLDNGKIPFQHIVFRVLSNQGNIKYTCIYRIRLYADDQK